MNFHVCALWTLPLAHSRRCKRFAFFFNFIFPHSVNENVLAARQLRYAIGPHGFACIYVHMYLPTYRLTGLLPSRAFYSVPPTHFHLKLIPSIYFMLIIFSLPSQFNFILNHYPQKCPSHCYEPLKTSLQIYKPTERWTKDRKIKEKN